LQAKRKISEKLEQLNQAREQIETIQREIYEMKEQENISLCKNHHTRTLDQPEEPRKKISSREMESHSS
jgi:FtsZ-binding cell division protein ZapB